MSSTFFQTEDAVLHGESADPLHRHQHADSAHLLPAVGQRGEDLALHLHPPLSQYLPGRCRGAKATFIGLMRRDACNMGIVRVSAALKHQASIPKWVGRERWVSPGPGPLFVESFGGRDCFLSMEILEKQKCILRCVGGGGEDSKPLSRTKHWARGLCQLAASTAAKMRRRVNFRAAWESNFQIMGGGGSNMNLVQGKSGDPRPLQRNGQTPKIWRHGAKVPSLWPR